MFMVDERAKKLLNYYNKWTIAKQLTKEPVRCDEFEIGRRSHVFHMPMGSSGTLSRFNFDLKVYCPAIAGIAMMRSYETMRATEEEFERGSALNEGGVHRASRAFVRKGIGLPDDVEELKRLVLKLKSEAGRG